MNPVRSIRIIACLLALTFSWKLLTGAQNAPPSGLQFAPGPSDGQRLALAAAKNIPNAGPVDALHALPSLPLYTLESDPIAAGSGLETATPCCFQYLIESRDARFVGGYEARMIYANLNNQDFPPLPLVAVWLKSLQKGEDLIYPLQAMRIPPNSLYSRTEFLKRLRPLLANVQWSSDYDLHAYFVDRFLESEGNGISRVYQPPMSIRDSMRLRITSRETYSLDSFDLIGVGKHPDPVAFLGRHHQSVAMLRQTRRLTAFESRAVAELIAGEDVAVETNHAGRFVVGALRAKEDCLRCHGGKTGDVLGALSYRLTPAEPRNPVVAVNIKSR